MNANLKRLALAVCLSVALLYGTVLYTTVNNLRVTGSSPITTFTNQGLYLTWNHLSAGETDFVNDWGGGVGGYRWYNIAPGGTLGGSPLMSLDQNGGLSATNLTASGVTGRVFGFDYGHSSGCTTSGSASYGTCTSTVTWTHGGFANTTYAASCLIINPSGVPTIQGATKTNTTITVTIMNGTANGQTASGGSLDCVASEN